MLKKIICLMLTLLMLAGLGCACAQEQPDDPWEMVLLIGTDTRKDEGAAGRADAIMVGAVHRDTGAIRLISLARDMWITLPGTSSHNKINATYRIGGVDMLLDTVNEVLGLEIERYAAINFYGFCDMIDTLGGVTVALDEGEASAINRKAEDEYGSAPENRLEAGATEATLNGVQALAYSRIRNLDNDFGRTGRQRKVLTAVMQKVAKMNPLEMLSFASECMTYVETNIGLTEMMELGMLALSGGLEDFDQLALPAVGDYRYDSADGVSKVIFKPEAVIEKAQQFLYTQE